MDIDPNAWSHSFDEGLSRTFGCPTCGRGQISVDSKSIQIAEPKYSSNYHREDWWEPENIVHRFSAKFQCNDPKCEEIVFVHGDGEVIETSYNDYYGEYIQEYSTFLYPKSFYPSPNIFPIKDYVPSEVAKEIRMAFSIYWSDLSASVSRLRNSLELALDALNVPSMDAKSKRLNLFQRIEEYEKISNDAEMVTAMNGLRIIGNIGAHGEKVKSGDYFKLLEVYSDALEEIFGLRSQKMRQKRQDLLSATPQT